MTLVKKYLFPFLLVISASCSYLPEGEIYPAGVNVEENRDLIEIMPEGGAASATGLVFYPGGLVDPHAYIELASGFALSGSGHRVLIVKMPSNLAVLASRSAVPDPTSPRRRSDETISSGRYRCSAQLDRR